MTDFNVIILAIFDENDFPNKALSDIHGKPMIQHVYDSAKNAGASEVVLATASQKAGMVAEDFGATVCMIIDDSLSGAAMLGEVSNRMGWNDDALIVYLSGDAPLTPASVIQQVADNLVAQPDVDCATLYSYVPRRLAEKEYTVCMTVDKNSHVLYLSRCPIPYQGTIAYDVSRYRSYIDINACRAGLLRELSALPRSELEAVEGIEALKMLHNGFRIHAAEANSLIGQRVISEVDLDKVKLQISPDR